MLLEGMVVGLYYSDRFMSGQKARENQIKNEGNACFFLQTVDRLSGRRIQGLPEPTDPSQGQTIHKQDYLVSAVDSNNMSLRKC